MLICFRYVSGLDQGKGMYLLFIKPEISTPSGLMARPVLTSYYKSPNFRNRPFNKFNIYTSPDETILCPDSKQSMFCQLLCGLIQRDEVLRVGAVFASAFLRAIKFLEDHWQELCSNIRSGDTSEWITDLNCRNSVYKFLNAPNPMLADLIEFECRGASWEGIIKRLWPRTKYVEVIVTGSMAQYIPTLEFYSGGLPLVSTMYASSECYFGINLKPLSEPSDVSYTLLPTMAYFEFLPVNKKHNEQEAECNGVQGGPCQRHVEAIDLVDVKLGHYYELVVTTFTGEFFIHFLSHISPLSCLHLIALIDAILLRSLLHAPFFINHHPRFFHDIAAFDPNKYCLSKYASWGTGGWS